MAKPKSSNSTGRAAPTRDTRIGDRLEQLRRKLWQVDGIIDLAVCTLQNGGNVIDGSLHMNLAEQVGQALQAASKLVTDVNGDLEPDEFLEQIDREPATQAVSHG